MYQPEILELDILGQQELVGLLLERHGLDELPAGVGGRGLDPRHEVERVARRREAHHVRRVVVVQSRHARDPRSVNLDQIFLENKIFLHLMTHQRCHASVLGPGRLPQSVHGFDSRI